MIIYVKNINEIDDISFPPTESFLLKVIGGNDTFHPRITSPVLSIFSVGLDKIYVVNHLHDEYYKIKSEDFFYKICEKIKDGKKNFIINLKRTSHFFEKFLSVNFHDVDVYNHVEKGIDPTHEHPEYSLFYKDKNSVGLNVLIPIVKHVEEFKKNLKNYNFESYDKIYEPGYLSIVRRIIPFLYKIEKHGIYLDTDILIKHFGPEKLKYTKNNIIYNDYNVFSATGRPSNSCHNINFAALEKHNGEREMIVSRYGKDGMLVLFDFRAYHPHLLGKLTNFKFPKFDDLYIWLTEQMAVISPDRKENLKGDVFTQLYGRIEPKYLKIEYFKTIDTFIKGRWKYYQNNGYVDTPVFKRSITSNHFPEKPFPNMITNYLLQAYETERNCLVMESIENYLSKSKKLTIPVLYSYDSVLFDCHKDDGIDCISNINNIMIEGNFPVKVEAGNNFHNMKKVKV